jgi:hypothetical protein
MVDVLSVEGKLQGFRLSPESSGESLRPRLAYARGDDERTVFHWAGLELSRGGDYELSLDPENRAVAFRNESANASRHFLIIDSVDRKSGETHTQAFGPFSVPSGASQNAQILDWPHVTRLLCSVDTDGDGVAEATDVVEATPCGIPGERADADEDGFPDACDEDLPNPSADFRRADANQDGRADISDAIFGLGFLFQGGIAPVCMDAADANDDGTVDISDAVTTLGVIFLGQGEIPSPGLSHCGPDPTPDELTCENFEACEDP